MIEVKTDKDINLDQLAIEIRQATGLRLPLRAVAFKWVRCSSDEISQRALEGFVTRHKADPSYVRPPEFRTPVTKTRYQELAEKNSLSAAEQEEAIRLLLRRNQ